MMKNCADIRVMISDYIDGELKLSEMRKLTKHLEICPACREEYEELKQISEVCRDMEEVELPADFKAELYKKLDISVPDKRLSLISNIKKSVGSMNRYAKFISTAAACLFIVFIARGFLDNPFRYDNSSLNSRISEGQSNESVMYGGIGSNQTDTQNNTAKSEKSAPKTIFGSTDGSKQTINGIQPGENQSQQSSAVQLFDLSSTDAAMKSGSVPPVSAPAVSTPTVSAPAAYASAYAITTAPTAAPETESVNSNNKVASQNSTQIGDEVPKEDPAVLKNSILSDNTAAKAAGTSRSGYTSRGIYMEISLTGNQNNLSDPLAERIKKLASEYNQAITESFAAKSIASPGAPLTGTVLSDTADKTQDIETMEIKIEEGKEQEFLNKLNTLINTEEGKITINELAGESTGTTKEGPDKTAQDQDDLSKPRYTTIVIIFQKVTKTEN